MCDNLLKMLRNDSPEMVHEVGRDFDEYFERLIGARADLNKASAEVELDYEFGGLGDNDS